MSDRVRFERHRLQVISTWPESDLRRAALASAQAALAHELALMKSLDAISR
jgi:hypothetical protein